MSSSTKKNCYPSALKWKEGLSTAEACTATVATINTGVGNCSVALVGDRAAVIAIRTVPVSGSHEVTGVTKVTESVNDPNYRLCITCCGLWQYVFTVTHLCENN